jgi:hypothetical protein
MSSPLEEVALSWWGGSPLRVLNDLKNGMDSAKPMDIPQEGTAKGGESLLLKTSRSCSTGSGGSNQVQASTPYGGGVAKHAATPKTSGMGPGVPYSDDQEVNPFERSLTMRRTPPSSGQTLAPKETQTDDMEVVVLDTSNEDNPEPDQHLGRRHPPAPEPPAPKPPKPKPPKPASVPKRKRRHEEEIEHAIFCMVMKVLDLDPNLT